MQFDNSYARLPERFSARVNPAVCPAPELLAWNASLAEELGLDALSKDRDSLAQIFSGNALLPGTEPIALAYAGHQFGNFVPQLGDGRAVLLGELVDKNGKRRDLQLKGAGQTPFSRRGDGRSALGPVIREYLLSEAMHRLGVPTTRALAAVRTGEQVWREQIQPGGVFTRVAASHIRVGTFEYFAARHDREGLQALLDYAINRHYPQARDAEVPAVSFFSQVVEAQARLVAHWMSIGFIHGVMNTDNMSISGETIDYGPCAFLDEFDFAKVFSSIDRGGRYAYGQQATMALWNLTRLAEALLQLEERQTAFEEQLLRFEGLFRAHYLDHMRGKLGLLEPGEHDGVLVTDWLGLLEQQGLDYTLSFRQLAECAQGKDASRFGEFGLRWLKRLADQPQTADEAIARMNVVNPLVIPRNHRIEEVIEAAVLGDMQPFEGLLRALSEPYTEQPGLEYLVEPPRVEERVTQTFCGT